MLMIRSISHKVILGVVPNRIVKVIALQLARAESNPPWLDSIDKIKKRLACSMIGSNDSMGFSIILGLENRSISRSALYYPNFINVFK